MLAKYMKVEGIEKNASFQEAKSLSLLMVQMYRLQNHTDTDILEWMGWSHNSAMCSFLTVNHFNLQQKQNYQNVTKSRKNKRGKART